MTTIIMYNPRLDAGQENFFLWSIEVCTELMSSDLFGGRVGGSLETLIFKVN